MDREYGSIEKQIRVEASPQVVYGVISSPEHIAACWFDEADFDLTSCSAGVLAAGTAPGRIEVPIALLEAVAGTRFAFRWVAPRHRPSAPRVPHLRHGIRC